MERTGNEPRHPVVYCATRLHRAARTTCILSRVNARSGYDEDKDLAREDRCDFIFAFLTYGAFMVYKDAFILSRHGTPAIAHATFKRSYVPPRRVGPVFVYDMIFDEHRIEKEYHYPLESAEVTVVYDPSDLEHFMIGKVSGSALQLLRSDMKADFWFVFVWPVLVIVAAVAIVFSWRRQPPANSWAAEVVD